MLCDSQANRLDLAHPVAVFQQVFYTLGPNCDMPLERLYAPDIQFEDPLHTVQGIDNLRRYFDRMNAQITSCRFTFGECVFEGNAAVLWWTMHLKLRRGGSREIIVPGASHLKFTDRVHYQRDYFDAGALMYEHIPGLGAIVRWIKSRV